MPMGERAKVTLESDIELRKATATDVPMLAQARYALRSEINSALEDRVAFETRCAIWMTDNIERAQWHCWVAIRAGELLGNLWLEIVEKMPNPAGEPEVNGYITNFYVLPAARGREIGSGLLTEGIRWAKERGIHSLFLWPTTRSIAFYERHGFEFGRVLESNLHGKRYGG